MSRLNYATVSQHADFPMWVQGHERARVPAFCSASSHTASAAKFAFAPEGEWCTPVCEACLIDMTGRQKQHFDGWFFVSTYSALAFLHLRGLIETGRVSP